jgi:hypothetical protein
MGAEGDSIRTLKSKELEEVAGAALIGINFSTAAESALPGEAW